MNSQSARLDEETSRIAWEFRWASSASATEEAEQALTVRIAQLVEEARRDATQEHADLVRDYFGGQQ
jgi:hypothetical protein